jgi:RsiW-degrading membrane proteinase PrsW (M82 family)
MFDTNTIIFALTGGLLPALVWLTFWLKEDSVHPEPKKLIFTTFIFGMLVVPCALAIQLFVNKFIFVGIDVHTIFANTAMISIPGVLMILVWSLSEELGKYFAAYHGGLKKEDNDEAVDDMIYMISAALGFAALENALFIFGPLLAGDSELAISTGNLRFIGATLLHIATASIIGAFRSFSHFKTNEIRKGYILSGLILAVGLHSAFNLFIIKNAEGTFVAFSTVWIIIIIIILIFERVKRIYVEKIK